MTTLRTAFTNNLINIPGWRTDRKIIVFESDDWGSIRMPSKEVYSNFISNGLDLSGSIYNRLDTLESNEDLAGLFDVLRSFKDYRGRHPVFTANFVVANPDFNRIRESDFNEYHYEKVTETLKKYIGRDNIINLWKDGLKESVFYPQFHGREHVNVVRWMKALQAKSLSILYAFNQHTTFSGIGDYNFMEVLDYDTPEDLEGMKHSIAEGITLFEEIFGFRPRSFIPPCYTWHSDIEDTLYFHGIKYIQGLSVQFIPTGSFGRYRKKYHFTGQRNRSGQYFLPRNCFFEPSLAPNSDPIDECLYRIKTAFNWRKPAVICSHRINYVGSLDSSNRTRNLSNLHDLLRQITTRWPDVEFMTSDQLGDLIAADKH